MPVRGHTTLLDANVRFAILRSITLPWQNAITLAVEKAQLERHSWNSWKNVHQAGAAEKERKVVHADLPRLAPRERGGALRGERGPPRGEVLEKHAVLEVLGEVLEVLRPGGQVGASHDVVEPELRPHVRVLQASCKRVASGMQES